MRKKDYQHYNKANIKRHRRHLSIATAELCKTKALQRCAPEISHEHFLLQSAFCIVSLFHCSMSIVNASLMKHEPAGQPGKQKQDKTIQYERAAFACFRSAWLAAGEFEMTMTENVSDSPSWRDFVLAIDETRLLRIWIRSISGEGSRRYQRHHENEESYALHVTQERYAQCLSILS